MKTIGLIGGMSWESTVEYYRIINREVNRRLGGHHSARLLLYSLEFAEMERLQREDRWNDLSRILRDAAVRLQTAGAELLLICTNTMHKVAGEVETSIDIPLLHIADATARDILAMGITKVGLLGTSYTMEQDFYKERLGTLFGIDVIVPEPDNRQIIDNIIYDELCQGKFHETSRAKFRKVMASLVEEGAEGVILGCTEIPLLVTEEDSPVPLFNTTRIHALKAVDLALG